MLKQLAEAAAEGSNSRMARKFYKEFDVEVIKSGARFYDPPNLKASASRGGHALTLTLILTLSRTRTLP